MKTKAWLLSFLSFLIGAGLMGVFFLNPFHWNWVGNLQSRLGFSVAHTPAAGPQESGQLWTCGMHPQVLSPEPGLCPICKMDLTPVRSSAPAPKTEERRIKHWRAPMDPNYISDKPGKSPMGMDLVPVYEDEVATLPGFVEIDPAFVQTIGVDSEPVSRGDIPFSIRTVGTMTYNEQQIYQVTTKYQGWIEKAHVNYVGQPVRKGQPLFEIYSPQLVATQQEYLQAVEYAEKLSGGEFPEVSERARNLVRAARQRLELWDISDEQIRELEKSAQVRRTLTRFSDVSGLVVSKMDQALEGMYVQPGMNLMRIVDLSTIWLEAEVFENQVPWMSEGQVARVEIPYQPGKVYRGRVRYIFPFFNESTRTLKLSIEMPNPGKSLRKGMYANVSFDVPSARDVLTVPESAVIHSGMRKLVVVDLGGGSFQVREVELGLNGSGLWEVKSGLREGDKVVISSQFLIDSESNLQAAIRKLTAAGLGDAKTLDHQH